MRYLILLLGVVASALLSVAALEIGHTTVAVPSKFLTGTFCPDNDPAAMFLVPGTGETSDILASQGATGTVDAIWIDLSLFDNGFASGSFLSIGPLTPDPKGATFREWRGLQHEVTHFYRLNAHVGDRWIELGRGDFRTNNCILLLQAFCTSDGTVNATFDVLRPGILEQGGLPVESWLDLSLFDNGYAAATYLSSGPWTATPPPGSTRNLSAWSGLLANRTHFYRQNTLYSSAGWVSQYEASFTTPDCAGLPKKYAPLGL